MTTKIVKREPFVHSKEFAWPMEQEHVEVFDGLLIVGRTKNDICWTMGLPRYVKWV